MPPNVKCLGNALTGTTRCMPCPIRKYSSYLREDHVSMRRTLRFNLLDIHMERAVLVSAVGHKQFLHAYIMCLTVANFMESP